MIIPSPMFAVQIAKTARVRKASNSNINNDRNARKQNINKISD